MNLQRTLSRIAATFLSVAAFVAFGCGGSDSTTSSSGPTAVFTPDVASPPAGSIALLPGSVVGATATIRVTVTGVNSFFGAAFRLKYDTTALLFSGMTDTGSFLRGPGITNSDVSFLADSTTVPGEVVITATRIDPTQAPPVDVTTTADLVTVNFIARRAIAPAATEGRIDFQDPKQVCDGTTGPSGCNPIAVTWSGGGLSTQ
jgi:hypothetical protein